MNDLELVVAQRRPVADGVIQLTLRDPAGDPLPAWTPGAHLDLVLRPDLVRQYSLCGDPADRTEWSVAVQQEPAGRGGSRLVHEEVTPGKPVRVRGPRNQFTLARAARYVFIAGGIGITPIKPMIAAAHAAGADWRLLYGGRTRATMAFAAELRAAYGEKVQLCPQDEVGLLDLPGCLGTPARDTLVYCCGPEPLLEAVQAGCHGWPPGALHVERFAPAAASGGGVGFEVELALTGGTLAVAPDTSILQAVEQAGIPVLSSCREGTCGTCETVVRDGVPDHRDSLLTDAERAAGEIMFICVSRSLTPRLVLEL